MNLILNIIINIVEVYGLAYILHSLLNRKIIFSFSNLLPIFILGLINGFVVSYLDISIFKFILHINFFLYTWYVSKQKIQQIIILCSFTYSLGYINQTILFWFFQILNLSELLQFILLIFLYTLITIIICKFPIHKIFDIICKEILLQLFFFIITIIFISINYKSFTLVAISDLLIVAVSVIGLIITMKKLFYYTNKFPAIHHELKNTLAGIYISANSQNTLEQVQSDINNYMSIMGINFALSTVIGKKNTDNLNLFIEYKKISSQKNIFFQTNINYYEDNALVPITSITYILGILIDNAIDASLPGNTIIINIQCAEYNLDIEVINNYATYVNLKNLLFKASSKSEFRGYGLKNLNKVVDLYNGKIILHQNTNQILFGIEIRN